MPLDREQVYVALFERLQKALPGVDCSRQQRSLDSIPRLPALDLTADEEVGMQEERLPTKWVLTAMIDLYAPAAKTADDTITHDLQRKIDAALAPQMDDPPHVTHTTLGGLCRYCWITEVGRGRVSGKVVTTIHLEMMVVT